MMNRCYFIFIYISTIQLLYKFSFTPICFYNFRSLIWHYAVQPNCGGMGFSLNWTLGCNVDSFFLCRLPKRKHRKRLPKEKDWRWKNSFSGQTRIYHAACRAPINVRDKSSSSFTCARTWWRIPGWGEAGDECDHMINSTIPPPPPPALLPLDRVAFIFVRGAERTSAENGRARQQPLLEIGCAEKRLEIDPPLITVCLKYLSARAPFKHTVSQGFFFFSTLPWRFSNHHSNRLPLIFLLKETMGSYPSSCLKKIKHL